MNLQDLTNYVTTKSQLVEADDQAAAQLFLSKRYELIYNSYLWKDSMGISNVEINPVTNLDHRDGVVLLPQMVDRLVAARTHFSSVKIQGLEHFYRIDWDAFKPNGWTPSPAISAPTNTTTVLTPANASFGPLIIWRYDNLTVGKTYLLTVSAAYQQIYFAGSSVFLAPNLNVPLAVTATSVTMFCKAQASISPTFVTTLATLTSALPPGASPTNTNSGGYLYSPREMSILNPIWLTVRPLAGTATIAVTGTYQFPNAAQAGLGEFYWPTIPGQYYRFTPGANETSNIDGADAGSTIFPNITSWQAVSNFTTFIGTMGTQFSGKLELIPTLAANQSLPGMSVVLASDNPAADAGVNIKVTWSDKTDRYTVTGALPMTLTPTDGSGYVEIESVFKPVTTGNIIATVLTGLTQSYNAATGAATPYAPVLGKLAPATLNSPQYQRLRIFPVPSGPVWLNVLGKKPFTPLVFATEVPAIRNLDNCLIAFAMGDLLERSRQFGKAQQQYTEAAQLLEELAKLETLQAANNTQFIPQSGYGDPYFGPGTQGYFAGEC